MRHIPELNDRCLTVAIQKGINYLLSKQENGRWRGFPTLAGESDVWVTGFIVAHIHELCGRNAIINEALQMLMSSRQPSNGWSYNTSVPSDADSTAWCMLALKNSALLSDAEMDRAKSFLWSHYKDEGIATYRIDSGIREFISAPNTDSIKGWTSVHTDVTIAAVLADMDHENVPKILSWLTKLITHEGVIDSYWWRSDFYTSTLLLRALSQQKESLATHHENALVKTLFDRQLPDGGFGLTTLNGSDAFCSALGLELFVYLSYLDVAEGRDLCAKHILNSQHKDGSWGGSHLLQIPAPHALNPNVITAWSSSHGGGNSYVEDQDGLFATALSCFALHCYKNLITEKLRTQ